MIDYEGITERSLEVIEANDMGGYSVPNLENFGKSQFLWDSCLVAEAMAYYDPERAMQEIRSLLGGQRPNGMVPNEVSHNSSVGQRIIFGTDATAEGLVTSGITQPPLIARTVTEIGKQLDKDTRQRFYKQVFHPLVRYHSWLLDERVVDDTYLVGLVHPYESGMDNIPSWRTELHDYWFEKRTFSRIAHPIMVYATGAYRLAFADLKHAPIEERSDNKDVLSSFLQTHALKKHKYNMKDVWRFTDLPVQQDVGFNAVFADANEALLEIEEEIADGQYEIPGDLFEKLRLHQEAVHQFLWREGVGDDFEGYANRDPRTGDLIAVNTAAGLFPLLTESDSSRRSLLLERLFDEDQFWTNTPIPSVARNDQHFHETAYWRGVSWPFVRFIIEKALMKGGEFAEAHQLRRIALNRPSEPAKSEYDHPITGEALGTIRFGAAAAHDIIFAQHEAMQPRRLKRYCYGYTEA